MRVGIGTIARPCLIWYLFFVDVCIVVDGMGWDGIGLFIE